MLLPKDPKDPSQSAAVMKFFDWGFAHGNEIAVQLLYIPLPEAVQDAVRAVWQQEVPGDHVTGRPCSRSAVLSAQTSRRSYHVGDAVFAHWRVRSGVFVLVLLGASS